MPLHQCFYADIACERGEAGSDHYGSEDHMCEMFKAVATELEQCSSVGVRSSRWFSWEHNCTKLFDVGAKAHLFLLVCVGMLRGFWKSWSETPMARGNEPVGMPEGIPDDDPIAVRQLTRRLAYTLEPTQTVCHPLGIRSSFTL
eukprot:1269340-Amphidinium_carterae.1